MEIGADQELSKSRGFTTISPVRAKFTIKGEFAQTCPKPGYAKRDEEQCPYGTDWYLGKYKV